MAYPEAMTRLLAELERLPGIGPRTAERLAHHLIGAGRDGALALAHAIEAVATSLRPCSTCGHVADADPCPICSDASRDRRRILVVATSRDLESLERAGWRGLYHVIDGAARAGAGGDGDPLEPLRRRIEREPVEELVLGTDPDFEGDGTALRIAELVRRSRRPGLAVSRLARGVPAGSAIEYANPAVLAEALLERRAVAASGDEAAP